MCRPVALIPAILVLLIGQLCVVICEPRPFTQDANSFANDIIRALQRRNHGFTPKNNVAAPLGSSNRIASSVRGVAVQKPVLAGRTLLPRQSYGNNGGGGYNDAGNAGYDSGAPLNPPQEYLFYAYPRPQTSYAALSQAAKPIPQIYNPCLYYLKGFNQTRFGLAGQCGDPIPYNLTSQRPLEPRSDLFGYPNYYIPKHFIPLGYGRRSDVTGANSGDGGGYGYGSYEGGGYGNGNKTREKKLFFFNYPPRPEYREPEADIYGYPGFYIPKIFVPHGFGAVDDGSFANSKNFSTSGYEGGYGNDPARQGGINNGGGAGGYGAGNSAGYGGGLSGGQPGYGGGAGYGGGGGFNGGGNAIYGNGGYSGGGFGTVPSRQMMGKK